MAVRGSGAGRKRGAHAAYVSQAFLKAVGGESLQLTDLTQYDKQPCLWQAECQNPRHVLYRQVGTIARGPAKLGCRVCAPKWHGRSKLESTLYTMLEEMQGWGCIAVESHVLQEVCGSSVGAGRGVRQHASDVWLVDQGKVVIELDGSQHASKPMHGEDMADRLAKDQLWDKIAVQQGWWVVRVLPGNGVWLAKAKAAIEEALQGVREGRQPAVVHVR
jgi:very-short-patch-repair endonuclease